MIKTKRRIKWFWIFYALLIAAIIILAVRFLRYVNDSLLLFEEAQPESYMEGVLSSIKAQSPSQLLLNMELPELPYSPYNNEEAFWLDRVQRLLDSELSWRGSTEIGRTAVYELYSDGVKAATVTIESVKEDLRLKLMSIPTWELKSIVPVAPDLYSYTISYPSGYRVLINGQELSAEMKTGEEPVGGFEYEAQYVAMPVMLSYQIDNLLSQPQLEVYNNLGEEMPCEFIDGALRVEPVYYSSDFPEDLKAELDVLKIAETWSKFLTKDLAGPRYGLEEARAYFIKDSVFWNMAYDFATGVDITFVSAHELQSFTNESVTQYIRYTENCFSCVVYFEKNMTLSRSGAPRTDVFNSRLFFVYYDDSEDGIDNPRWLIADMQAVVED